MPSQGWGKIFEGNLADMYTEKILLALARVKQTCQVCADTGARTPMQVSIETVSDKYFLYLYLFSQIYMNI
jgi:uncharacterized membrane protein